jgi:hypothetical protein
MDPKSEDKKPAFIPAKTMTFDLSKARSLTKALNIGATYTREQRSQLSADGKAKFTKLATESLEQKFEIVDSKTEKLLENNFDFMTHVERLRRRLMSYGMNDVFNVAVNYASFDGIKPPDLSVKLDILTSHQQLALPFVQGWSWFIYRYGDELTIENLQLSESMLLNSCDTELFKKVNNELSTMDVDHRGGPVVFFLITRYVVALTEKTIRAFLHQLQNLKVTKFPNEDINEFAAVFKNTCNRLIACDRLPKDIRDICYEGIQSCSVIEFRRSLEVHWTLETNIVTLYESILDFSQIRFTELSIKNKWLPKQKKASTFKATSSHNDSSQNNNNQANKTSSDNNNGSNNRRYDKKPKRPVDHTPPKQGEPHTRKRSDGKDEHWCGRCKDGGRWGNHTPDGHDKWVSDWHSNIKKRQELRKEKQAESKSADASGSKTPGTEINDEAKAKLRPVGRSTTANLAAHF